ncbi:ExeM/NucH family extracellular endonuclease [Corynebacterium sp. CCM 9185]|uniref:ExeM/NucH family extracellular endonuclease n=1 Tax=Corynebacterium marambiense TaxID=2765364 RepID=A0ABS0VTH2_9CORY|nr:ExeM/NucH family extracellular endonuclease [Corynebacterium marambiense]MBI9000070.1 ExeM/NucH family extracellular endonuclease [Corynebacterium marambiense]MCK7663422.1 ExeM/NucH family extracellular endonuclease [Corynebacterium marambiense]
MTRRFSLTAAALATVGVTILTGLLPATATPEGDNIVISQVYGGGGNKGAALTSDFIELYNPTGSPISVDGWTLQYLSAQNTAANPGQISELTGTIAPRSHLLVRGARGSGGTVDFTADIDAPQLAVGSRAGAVVLATDATPFNAEVAGGSAVDILGYGGAAVSEGTPAQPLDNTLAAIRGDDGADTDDNATDFTATVPSPRYSGGAAMGATVADPEPDPGTPGPADPREVTIAEIQGVGDVSPLVDEEVRTTGIITATWPDGGLGGFALQTGGTGRLHGADAASTGVFIYTGRGSEPSPDLIGSCVAVTGKVSEFHGQTQVAGRFVPVDAATTSDCAEAVTPITDTVPEDPALREAHEGMLFQPAGAHTVTENYNLNRYGSFGVVAGETPLFQATDVVEPGAAAVAYEWDNARRPLTIDDGSSRDFLRNSEARDVPLPYLSADGETRPLRTGDHVAFSRPMVLGYFFGAWTLQPTTPVDGTTPADTLPVSWTSGRDAERGGPDSVGGDTSLASFNVLNFFTDLGRDEPGCAPVTDRAGTPVTGDRCTVRGAYTPEALADQRVKIVSAINTLDADILGLEEIEDSSRFGHDRDATLNQLVDALNAAGGNWAAVPSPATVPGGPGTGDVIRTAFIYDPARVRPVGESRILMDDAFTGIAREPLAQEFAPVDGGTHIVAVVNHFKSKGSVARGDVDTGDGQGNNARLRTAQSRALVRWLAGQRDWGDLPQFIIGDLNSYSREDAVRVIEDAGFTNVGRHFDAGTSYQYGGRLGSLDHVLANQRGMAVTTGADVWDINADESTAFEYSRRNFNAVDLFSPDPFRASDHDPIKVGLSLGGGTPGDVDPGPGVPEPGTPDGSTAAVQDLVQDLTVRAVVAGFLALLGLGALIAWLTGLPAFLGLFHR